MKISGFAQLRNELSAGNLNNWFNCMNTICDNIFIYDQNSTDGSIEEYKKHKNVHVIESKNNNFYKELSCKSELLHFLKKESPDTDWILWLDGDEFLEKSVTKEFVHHICSTTKSQMLAFQYHNLWRSDVYYRLDSKYNWMSGYGRRILWKNTPKIHFPNESGLHKPQFPKGLNGVGKVERAVIHRGFAKDESIIEKYVTYKSNGQTGEALSRLIDETTLDVKKINNETLPEWFKITDSENPKNKPKLVDKYKERLKSTTPA